MHRPTKELLEEFLRTEGDGEDAAVLRAHLAGCDECRRAVTDMEDQARMLRLLRAPEEVQPGAGFYAGVMERIESRRRASSLYAFLDPGFARRLIYSSLAAVFVLGALLVYWESQPAWDDPSLVTLIASETPADEMVGSNPARDRQTMLLTLASYQE